MAIFISTSKKRFLKLSLSFGLTHSGSPAKLLKSFSLSVSTISAGMMSTFISFAAGYSFSITKFPSSKMLGVTNKVKSLLSSSTFLIFSWKLSPGVKNSSYQIAISLYSGILCIIFISSLA